MEKIGNRLAIILASAYLIVQDGVETSVIVSFLFAFIISCLGIYVSGKGILVGLVGGYVVLSFVYPVLILLYPVMIYEGVSLMYCQKKKAVAVCGLAVMVLRYAAFASQLSWFVATGIVLISGLAVWLSFIERRHGELNRQYIQHKNNSTELTMALKKENRYILESQDSAIYVATLQERNRIAREIHDNVGHMLSRAILMTGALITITKEAASKEGLNGLKECLNEAMTSIRQSVHDLHDESIDLEQTIRNLIGNMEKYEVCLEYDISENVPRKVKYCLISIVKEGLSNVMKHSTGDRVTITMIEHPGFYKLSIIDNGECKEQWQAKDGIGLYNIRERVEGLSGRLNIIAEKTGFQIYVSIPK